MSDDKTGRESVRRELIAELELCKFAEDHPQNEVLDRAIATLQVQAGQKVYKCGCSASPETVPDYCPIHESHTGSSCFTSDEPSDGGISVAPDHEAALKLASSHIAKSNLARCYKELRDAALQVQPTNSTFPLSAERKWFIDRIVLRMCEIPDRNSPDDQPEMMLLTPEEASGIIEGTFEEYDERIAIGEFPRLPAQVQPAQEPFGHYIETEGIWGQARFEVGKAPPQSDARITPLFTRPSPPTEQPKEAADGWISCDERLPEARKSVLIYTPENKCVFTATIEDDKSWRFFGGYEEVMYEISHWKPIPASPGAQS